MSGHRLMSWVIWGFLFCFSPQCAKHIIVGRLTDNMQPSITIYFNLSFTPFSLRFCNVHIYIYSVHNIHIISLLP